MSETTQPPLYDYLGNRLDDATARVVRQALDDQPNGGCTTVLAASAPQTQCCSPEGGPGGASPPNDCCGTAPTTADVLARLYAFADGVLALACKSDACTQADADAVETVRDEIYGELQEAEIARAAASGCFEAKDKAQSAGFWRDQFYKAEKACGVAQKEAADWKKRYLRLLDNLRDSGAIKLRIHQKNVALKDCLRQLLSCISEPYPVDGGHRGIFTQPTIATARALLKEAP